MWASTVRSEAEPGDDQTASMSWLLEKTWPGWERR